MDRNEDGHAQTKREESQMKAVVYTEYGSPDVLQLQEVAKPTPKDHEILIKVQATSVNYGDLVARNFKAIAPCKFNMPLLFWILAKIFFGFSKPKIAILGSEFAGKVEAIGKDVQAFQPDDQVFGYLGQRMGAYAEYLCMPEDGCVTIKPANMSYTEAAVVPYGTIMALHLLRQVKLQRGQKVLINGASGGIGSPAVQIAKYWGAEVTGVCGTPRLEFVKALGADQVIDYTKADFTQIDETYDLIFDILGKSSFAQGKRALKPNGRYLYASFKLKQLCQMLWTSKIGNKKVICAIAPGSREDLIAVKALIEAGKIRAIIDKSYPLAQAAEAHRDVEQGDKKGHVVITVEHQ
jgi:NADPH:quinone reductase-like Zn-dependent oxidoreductase